MKHLIGFIPSICIFLTIFIGCNHTWYGLIPFSVLLIFLFFSEPILKKLLK